MASTTQPYCGYVRLDVNKTENECVAIFRFPLQTIAQEQIMPVVIRPLNTEIHYSVMEEVKRAHKALVEIFGSNFLRLLKTYGDDLKTHQEAFVLWLLCIKEVIRFYDLTLFKGDLHTRKAFVKELPWHCRTNLFRHYFRTRALISTFLHDHKITMQGLKQMADSILSELVAENRGEVKETTIISHQTLCAWYSL
jgi:hypothetical protein